MLEELKGFADPFYIASFGTDGVDGPTDAAGAWITDQTLRRADICCLNVERYLSNNDSHNFFKHIEQLIRTGPTGTNVMDVRLFYLPGKEV
jgi:glycerate-2-kinase